MKKFVLFFVLSSSLMAFDLNNILNGITKDVFGAIDNSSQGLLGVCYVPQVPNFDSLDPCEALERLESLKEDVCSLAPNFPFMQKRNKEIGINGLKSLCNAQKKKFEDISKKTYENTIEYAGVGNDNAKGNKKYQEYLNTLQKWNVSDILKEDNSISNYLKNGKLDEVALFLEYGLSEKKSVKEINLDDLGVSKTLEEHKQNITNAINSLNGLNIDTSPNNVGSVVKAKVSGKQEKASEVANEYLSQVKESFEIAKRAELGFALKGVKKIPIPTQEYIESFRYDLRPKLISQIRKQEMEEVYLSAQISKKWDKRYELAKLLADKEVILAQEFDEMSARSEIEKIVNSVNIGNGSGTLPIGK